jgi:hypothetical protein
LLGIKDITNILFGKQKARQHKILMMPIASYSIYYLSHGSVLLHAEERGQGIVMEVTQSPESRRRNDFLYGGE